MFTRLKKYLVLLGISATLAVTGCNSGDETDDDQSVDVGKPANDILVEEGSLHIFRVQDFYQDNDDIDNDIMILTIDNFAPSSSTVEPDEDEDQTLNDLPYTQQSWKEDNISWASNSNPLLDSKYQKPRSYRVLKDNVLQAAPAGTLNKPVYETIDDNVFERQLGASFVWDFGNYGDNKSKQDVSNKKLEDYDTLYGYSVLPHISVWSDLDGQTAPRFSEGAVIYAASRSVAYDAVVVEAVINGNDFDLAPTRIAAGSADLTAALALYPYGGSRLAYQFTVDYDKHYTVYMNFDTVLGKARLYDTSGGSTPVAEADLTLHADKPYAEIDTMALTSGERLLLNLPSYFNPVIIGPFDGAYFYGKHYVRTNETNRLLLEPVFFLNPEAKSDVEDVFKAWRNQEHLQND